MKTGPKPSCHCGVCKKCRQRVAARRRYRGEAPINPKRFRQPQLALTKRPALIGYIAGLLDGEGSVTKENGRWRIQIAMTDQAVIEWLGTMGGTVRERNVVGNRQPAWGWRLMRQVDVHAFLLEMLPLLRVKRERAEHAIADIEAEGVLVALERVA